MDVKYMTWIGRQVRKKSPRPFKSGSKINTVKNVIEHPVLARRPAFTFVEDDSAVECRICELVEGDNA